MQPVYHFTGRGSGYRFPTGGVWSCHVNDFLSTKLTLIENIICKNGESAGMIAESYYLKNIFP